MKIRRQFYVVGIPEDYPSVIGNSPIQTTNSFKTPADLEGWPVGFDEILLCLLNGTYNPAFVGPFACFCILILVCEHG